MIPIQITCQDFPISDSIRHEVRNYAGHLEYLYGRIIRCELFIRMPHRHKQKGRIFHVTIRLHMPGPDVVASRELEEDAAHEVLHIALADGFRAVERRLEEQARRMRGEVKRRMVQPRGRVVWLDVEGEFGFLETEDGQEVYFHRNSVIGDPSRIRVGSKVRFHLEDGDNGPQASSLHLIRSRQPGPMERQF